jgi:RHS repeat-associated protein
VPGVGQNDPAKTGDVKWAYFHADAKDNRALTDRAGVVSKRWEYDPFGQIRTQSGTAASDFGYVDEQRDGETGLINLRARYYDPALGRFLSRDSLTGTASFSQSLNRYSYALNSPVGLIDPSGRKPDTNGDDKDADNCANPGRYTGSCSGDPPDFEYWNDGEEQARQKEAGKAAQQAQARSPDEQEAQLVEDNRAAGALTVGQGRPMFYSYRSLDAGGEGIECIENNGSYECIGELTIEPGDGTTDNECVSTAGGSFDGNIVNAGCQGKFVLIDGETFLVQPQRRS